MSPSSTAPTSVIAQIKTQQGALGLSDQHLCEAVGFEREIVLKLILDGTMKLPINKIPVFAAALALDPAELLRAALIETSPELLTIIQDVFNPMSLTSTEVNLIKHLRKLSGDTPGAPIVFEGRGVIALVAV